MKKLAGGLYNLCPPRLSIYPRLADQDNIVIAIGQIMVSPDGSTGICKGTSMGCRRCSVEWEISPKKNSNGKFQGNFDRSISGTLVGSLMGTWIESSTGIQEL